MFYYHHSLLSFLFLETWTGAGELKKTRLPTAADTLVYLFLKTLFQSPAFIKQRFTTHDQERL
ncbi:MAG: hypothetical protein ABIQ31_21110 [Ferruginibacter sp.]